MIITMVSMGVMQMTVDQVINMIAVWDGFVTAIGAMDMPLRVASQIMVAGAAIGMGGIDFNLVFLHLPAFLVYQVAVFNIIGMPAVFDRCVPAAGSMLMIF